MAAFSSLVYAEALTGYATIFCIRAQAYIWGHILIVVGGLYAVLMKIVRIDLKSFLYGLGVLVLLLIPAIILNSYFNDVLGYGVNYFYVYNSDGVPFEFLYIGERAQYGWFTINWIYTLSVVGCFIVILFLIFCIQKLFYRKNEDYQTYNIFQAKKLKAKV